MANELQLKENNNCLSLIRIIAAFQVMLGHMIEHLELPGNASIIHLTFFLRGVPVFFGLSGFLIWFSMDRSKAYFDYLKKRFWRIYPELWVAVIIELIVLCVLYRGWTIKSLLLFAFTQGTIFQFYTPSSLRGYGVGTPNGALWTIGIMIQFYLVAWFFRKIMKGRKASIWIIGFFIAFLVSLIGQYLTQSIIQIEIIGKLYDQTFIKYFWLFYFGMFIAEFKEKTLVYLVKYWIILLIMAFLFFITGWDLYSGYYLGWSLFLTSGLIGFAYRFPKLSIKHDISYGVFLYHMIVVNVFVNYGVLGKWFFVVPIVLITAVLAYLSTMTVGRISLKMKKKTVDSIN